jgi:hypothetical protein
LEVKREQKFPAPFADLREARIQPIGQFPVLYGIGVAFAKEYDALGDVCTF